MQSHEHMLELETQQLRAKDQHRQQVQELENLLHNARQELAQYRHELKKAADKEAIALERVRRLSFCAPPLMI